MIPQNDSPTLCRTLAILLLAALTLCATSHAAVRKPNFLFIITDDQRWDAIGAVQREQGEQARFPWFETPSMDRLAAGGIRFRNAFVTLSLCSPSRAAFLTGNYNHINGITTNSAPFPAATTTHATLLQNAGYRTAYIGKWHMGQQKGQRPGFNYSASYVGQGGYLDHPFEIDGVSRPTTGWIDDVATDFAIDWLKNNRAQPFSMVLGFKSPHSPRGGENLPARLRTLYAAEKSRPVPNLGIPPIYRAPTPPGKEPSLGLADNAIHLDYLRHVKGVDENLGRLLDSLDALGIADDTVIVYTSDNGYYLGEHCLGDKRSLYEESLRIPMLVRYPRLFPKGQILDEMVLNIDLAPTFLDLAGVAIPDEMQGLSWKELAEGEKPSNWRNSFLAQYYKELGAAPTMYGIRTANAKLIRYPGRAEWTEVFNLTTDPYEIRNLAAEQNHLENLALELDAQVKAMEYEIPSGPNARYRAKTK